MLRIKIALIHRILYYNIYIISKRTNKYFVISLFLMIRSKNILEGQLKQTIELSHKHAKPKSNVHDKFLLKA